MNLVKFNFFVQWELYKSFVGLKIQFQTFYVWNNGLGIFTEKLFLHKAETARLINATCLQLIEHESFAPFIFIMF